MGLFKSITKAIGNTIAKPVHAVTSVAKGDFKQAGKDLKNTALGTYGEIAKRETGLSTDQILGLEAVIAATAGLAGSAGGTAAGTAGGTSAANTQLGLTGTAVPASAAAGGAAAGAGTAAFSGGAAGLAANLLGGASGSTIANLLGSAGAAATNYAGAKYAADKSAQSAEQINERQIAWEKERATNAHQWEVQDLVNAGLNPVLSAGGQGAATGGISAVQPDTSGYQAAGGALRGFFELLNSNRLANAQADNVNAQTTAQLLQNPYIQPKLKSEIANTVATTKLQNANSAKALSDINKNAAEITKALAEADFAKRRASGKHFKIGGSFEAQGPGTKNFNAGKAGGSANIEIGI